jgi:hypothetical protein
MLNPYANLIKYTNQYTTFSTHPQAPNDRGFLKATFANIAFNGRMAIRPYGRDFTPVPSLAPESIDLKSGGLTRLSLCVTMESGGCRMTSWRAPDYVRGVRPRAPRILLADEDVRQPHPSDFSCAL